MTPKRDRLKSLLRIAKHREDSSTAAHLRRLREVEAARKMFVDAQHRAIPDDKSGSVDDLILRREKKASSARSALAAQTELRNQIQRSVEERNQMHADMRHRRTVERIDEDHQKAWANLAAQAAERALDDIAIAGWQRRQS